MSMNTFASADLTMGQLNAIVKKLGGHEEALAFLRDEVELKVTKRQFKTWRTLKLGTGLKTADDFRAALMRAGYQTGDWADDILGKPAFTVADEETEVELVVASVAELGFKQGATRKEIYDRALELGLDLCSAEVGPQLGLQYADQINREYLLIAMEPIADSGDNLNVFDVEHFDDGRWLSTNYGHPDSKWNPDSRWVFLRRKSAAAS